MKKNPNVRVGLVFALMVALMVMPGETLFAQSAYGVSFWRDLSRREAELEARPNYQDFYLDSTFSDEATVNPDWYVDMLNQGLMVKEANREGAKQARRFEQLKRAYEEWCVRKKERDAKQAADNLEIARQAAALTGTIPEFREQLVAQLKAVAGCDYEFLGGINKEEFTDITSDEKALTYVEKTTMTGADGKTSIYHYSTTAPWPAIASAEITFTQDEYAKKERVFQVTIKAQDKTIATHSQEEGKPAEDSMNDGAAIDLGTDEAAARRAVMLLRRAAGITNAPAIPAATASQDNDLSGVTISAGAIAPPTNTVTIEVVKPAQK